MAISIDWNARIIFVPKADLTLVQSSPTEIREMDLNWFRLQLKDLEDSEEGITFPDTHRHNTEVTLGGLTFARVIEIINDYTVTFEDGQYAVNLVGANSNVGDVVNVNQVSVRSQNSAGLISNPAIEYASFNGGVTVDLTSEYSGTIYPVGTPRQPVNNMADALLIAAYRGFITFYIVGDITLDENADYSHFTFIGESEDKTTITIHPNANVSQCEFYECTLTGTLDGDCKVKNARILDVNYISGFIELCVLDGTITLGGEATAVFLDCWSGNLLGSAIIDLGGSGQTLVMQNFNGHIIWQNKTGDEQIHASLNAGCVHIDSTVTNGYIHIVGVGMLEDNSTGSCVINARDLLSPPAVADAVWDKPAGDHRTKGTLGNILRKQAWGKDL